MDSLVPSILEQAPYIAALVVVVWTFVAHLQRRDRQLMSHLDKRDQTLRHINDESHAVHRESIDALRKNSEVIGQNTKVLEQASRAIERSLDGLHPGGR